ncbi:amidohydrolase family protein [Sphingopyxis sp.]|uniref:amidohydrolase family protein n=1 Tax=Sphingopyxis sp. TaxID=1908224 RepID=UPI003D6CA839
MIVDVWAQQSTERFMKAPWLDTLLRWTGKAGDRRVTGGEATLNAMNEAGVDITFLSAWHGPQGSLISNDEVADMIAAAPSRFRGLATVDLNDPMGSVRELKRVVDGKTFVGVRIVPWLWDLPPNDRRYYPIYAACVELGVPFCTQIGHTGPLCRSEPGRPIPYLDDVLLDFPELVVIGGHVGFPWIDEVLSLARKYPNFHVDTSAYAVHRLPAGLVDYMRGAGRSRIMFGTNWPMISPAACLAKRDALELDDEASALFLGGNAARVFGL